MVSRKIYHLNINEEFSVSWTSKLLTYFIDGFILRMRSQSIAYLPGESEHTYWILGLKVEVHSIWVLWTRWPSGMQRQFFLKWGGAGRATFFNRIQKVFMGLPKGCKSRGPALSNQRTHSLKNPMGVL